MRKPFTCVYREIWDDEKFYSLDDVSRLVYFFFLTSPSGNGLGCYKAGRAAMIEDSRMSAKAFGKGFGNALENGLLRYDEAARVVYIPTYLERNPPTNPNVIKSLAKDFIKIPDCILKAECYHDVRTFCEGRMESFVKAFREAFGEGFGESFKEHSGTYSSFSPSPSTSTSFSPSPSTSTSTSTSTLDVASGSGVVVGFDDFWAAYPKRVGKADARKKFTAAAKTEDWPGAQAVIAAVNAQAESPQWTKDGGQYIPNPATWLNQGRYLDEGQQPRSMFDNPFQRKLEEAAALERGEAINVECKRFS